MRYGTALSLDLMIYTLIYALASHSTGTVTSRKVHARCYWLRSAMDFGVVLRGPRTPYPASIRLLDEYRCRRCSGYPICKTTSYQRDHHQGCLNRPANRIEMGF